MSAGWAVFLAGVLLVHLPFALLMPPHMDDPVFLGIAENVGHRPFSPMSSPVIWEGRVWPDMMSYSHPPLLCYYMFGIRSVFGRDSSTPLHLGFLPFTLLLAWAFKRFFSFFGLPAITGAALAVSAPVVFLCGHTLMMDVPTLAACLWGVVLAFEGVRDDRPRRILAGGLAFAAGVLLSIASISLLLPACVYALLRKKNAIRNLLLAGAPACLALVGWLLLVYGVTGRFIFGDMGRIVRIWQARESGSGGYRLVYNFCAVGSAMVFPLAALALRWREIRGKLYWTAALAAGVAAAVLEPGWGSLMHAAVGLAFAAGLAAVVESLVESWWNARTARPGVREAWAASCVWLVALFTLTVCAYPHGAARYQLGFMPPVFLALLSACAGRDGKAVRTGSSTTGCLAKSPGSAGVPPANPPEPVADFTRPVAFSNFCEVVTPSRATVSRKVLLATWLAGQGALALVMGVADLDMARGFREAVSKAAESKTGGTVWIAAEWGLRSEAEGVGGRAILRYDTRPRPGDILIRPSLNAPTYETGYERPPYGSRISAVPVVLHFPFRVLDHRTKAGFWSDYWGPLPVWAAESPRLDSLEVFRISKTLPVNPGKFRSESLGFLPVSGAGVAVPDR